MVLDLGLVFWLMGQWGRQATLKDGRWDTDEVRLNKRELAVQARIIPPAAIQLIGRQSLPRFLAQNALRRAQRSEPAFRRPDEVDADSVTAFKRKVRS